MRYSITLGVGVGVGVGVEVGVGVGVEVGVGVGVGVWVGVGVGDERSELLSFSKALVSFSRTACRSFVWSAISSSDKE
jgi:hypothetical protein